MNDRQTHIDWSSHEEVPDAGSSEVAEPTERVFTVRELTHAIRGQLEDLGRLKVEGELSRISQPASGHLYFTLKDADAVLSCTIWRSRRGRALDFELKEGMHVSCRGALDVYAPRGSYSLIVDKVEQEGLGALLVQLEKRKSELRERGWFERARPLPRWPERVGVVASRDSAAFQDFLRTRSKRWPGYPVRLCHTPVQGPGAAPDIAQAISRLDASGVDVIVVIRGGGSLEDLWAFNELVVAEAVWNSGVPVLSGVGHETDWTLIDSVADGRAHTPTDAAQMVLPDRGALELELERCGAFLAQAMDARLEASVERLERASRARVLTSPSWMIDDRARALASLARRLELASERPLERAAQTLTRFGARLEGQQPLARLERLASRLAQFQGRLAAPIVTRLSQLDTRLEKGAASLRATSPLAVLERGYSITQRAEGGLVTDIEGLDAGQRIRTRLARGELISRVEDTIEPDEKA